MACPFFRPSHRLDQGGWDRPPRLPLGDPYSGVCVAHPAEPFAAPDELTRTPGAEEEASFPVGMEVRAGPVRVSEETQRELCNCGYARGKCQQFPEDGVGDAVRFSITGVTGGLVKLVYVVEKNHAPIEHGPLEYIDGQFLNGKTGEIPLGETLTAQARAFVESYLRRRV